MSVVDAREALDRVTRAATDAATPRLREHIARDADIVRRHVDAPVQVIRSAGELDALPVYTPVELTVVGSRGWASAPVLAHKSPNGLWWSTATGAPTNARALWALSDGTGARVLTPTRRRVIAEPGDAPTLPAGSALRDRAGLLWWAEPSIEADDAPGAYTVYRQVHTGLVLEELDGHALAEHGPFTVEFDPTDLPVTGEATPAPPLRARGEVTGVPPAERDDLAARLRNALAGTRTDDLDALVGAAVRAVFAGGYRHHPGEQVH